MTKRTVEKYRLNDAMYPRYHFLKQRLLSVHSRFINGISGEKVLMELNPDGREKMKAMQKNVDLFVERPALFLMGNRSDKFKNKFISSFIASSTFHLNIEEWKPEDILSERELKYDYAQPTVIVYVAAESFVNAVNHLTSTLPEEAWQGYCIVCSEKCEDILDLPVFSKMKTEDLKFKDPNISLGTLIQEVLENQVVSVLNSLKDFITKNLMSQSSKPTCEGIEEITVAVSRTLKTAVSKYLDRDNSSLDFIQQVYKETENRMCEILAFKYGVQECIVTTVIRQTNIKQRTEKFFLEKQDFDKQPKETREKLCEELVKQLEAPLKDLENNMLETFEMLSLISFEIDGVFRQAKILNPHYPELSSELQKQILSVDGVSGVGIMCGRLVVNTEEKSMDIIKEITKQISALIMNSKSKQLIERLEVKHLRTSSNRGTVHESGKCIRVNTNQSNSAAFEDTYSYGTLGCFVKVHENGNDGDMYALSSAHVFPDDAHSIVEIVNDHLNKTYCEFGQLEPRFKIQRGYKIDIAAIAVNQSVKDQCNRHLKNANGRENVIYEGDLTSLLDYNVYKWGSTSGKTEGLIVGTDYRNLDEFDGQHNLFIKSNPGSSEPFSSLGDSGSIVCNEDPVDGTVRALSILSGVIIDESTNKPKYSFSCYLKKNLQALSIETEKTFELYD